MEEEQERYKVKIGSNCQVAYDPQAILGSGAHGLVFQGIINNDKNKKVAVKLLKQSVLLMARNCIDYQREVNLLKKLDNPYILKFQLFHIDKKSNVYIVTELCQRSSLHTEIQRARLSFSRVFKYSYQIIYAMKYMHAMKCMHRDLKPENIFLTLEDNTKIGDLGIAKQILDEDIEKLVTNTIIGTPIYSSPQIILERKYNFKCDVWSVGCIIYEMLTSEKLFLSKNGESVKAIHKKFEQNKNEYLKNIQDPFWRKILDKMLAYQEKDRINFEQLFIIFAQEKNKKIKIKQVHKICQKPQKKSEKQEYPNKQQAKNTSQGFKEVRQIKQLKQMYDKVQLFLCFKYQKIKQTSLHIYYFDQTKMFYPTQPIFYCILGFLLCYWNKMEAKSFKQELGSQQIIFDEKPLALKPTSASQQFSSRINYLIENLQERSYKLDNYMQQCQKCILNSHYDTLITINNAQSLTDLLFNYKQKTIPASDVMKMFRSFLENYGIQKELISKKSPPQKLKIYRLIVGLFQLCEKETKFPNNPPYPKDQIINHFQAIQKTLNQEELRAKIQLLMPKRNVIVKKINIIKKAPKIQQKIEDALLLLNFRQNKVHLTYQYLSRFQKTQYFPISLCYKCILGFLLILLNKMQKSRLYNTYKTEMFEKKQKSEKETEIYTQFQKKRYQVLQGTQQKIDKLNQHLKQNADYILSPNRKMELSKVLNKIPDLKYILEKYNELETRQEQVTNLLKMFLRQFANPFQKIDLQLTQLQKLEVFRLIAAFSLLFDKNEKFPNEPPYDGQIMRASFESINTMNQHQLRSMVGHL